MVSRTRERMASLRRRRRGRLVSAPRVVVSFGLRVLVVIEFSGKVVGTRADGGTEPAAESGLVRAVGTEESLADAADFKVPDLLVGPTTGTNPLLEMIAHH